MPRFRVEGTKGDHHIAEEAPSQVKAEWVAAHYRAYGYEVTVTPLTSGSR